MNSACTCYEAFRAVIWDVCVFPYIGSTLGCRDVELRGLQIGKSWDGTCDIAALPLSLQSHPRSV